MERRRKGLGSINGIEFDPAFLGECPSVFRYLGRKTIARTSETRIDPEPPVGAEKKFWSHKGKLTQLK